MTFEQRLLSGIIVGITLWLVSKVFSFFTTRNTISAGILTDIELRIKSIKESLLMGFICPVLWSKSVQQSISSYGVNEFVEIGSGTVLSSLINSIDKETKTW